MKKLISLFEMVGDTILSDPFTKKVVGKETILTSYPSIGADKFKIVFSVKDDVLDISFYVELEGKWTHRITASKSNSAYKILGMVKNSAISIMKDYDVKEVHFIAKSNETTRVRLYELLLKKTAKQLRKKAIIELGVDDSYITYKLIRR